MSHPDRATTAAFATLTAAGAGARQAQAPRQNWVLDPVQDLLLVIAAPLLSLALALLAMWQFGAAQGAAYVILAHVVLTVAHHLPTFIRIYGDTELLQRFRWSFLLGPVVPLLFSAAVLVYLGVKDYPVEYFLYLYLFLALWDPWHFLRQHFGFMRIYDRHNAAPLRLASRMDWWLSAIWFLHIMAASSDWLPGLLEDLYRNARVPVLMVLPLTTLQLLAEATWWGAALMTLAYCAYLAWCLRRGYFVSLAKLALLVCTFGVMYLTYTPNALILQLAPAWGFKVGFATVGIVHMTQYLAIVWRYDQRIAQQGRSRPGLFTWLHARRSTVGIALAGLVYVACCLLYGDVVTTSHANRWVMSVMLAVGFTSTLMHYYFDGFIWKVRHRQNRAALDLQGSAGDGTSWGSDTARSPAGMLTRQLAYFGLPMLVLSIGAVGVWGGGANAVQRMYEAQRLSQSGDASAAADVARGALARMREELPVARRLALLRADSRHEAELAFLVYNEALYAHQLMPALDGRNPSPQDQSMQQQATADAAGLLLSAVDRGGDVAHAGRETLTREQASQIAWTWRRQSLDPTGGGP